MNPVATRRTVTPMIRLLERLWFWVSPRAELLQRLLFRSVLRQLEQQRRDTLELERLVLAIARIEGLGAGDDPARREPRAP